MIPRIRQIQGFKSIDRARLAEELSKILSSP